MNDETLISIKNKESFLNKMIHHDSTYRKNLKDLNYNGGETGI